MINILITLKFMGTTDFNKEVLTLEKQLRKNAIILSSDIIDVNLIPVVSIRGQFASMNVNIEQTSPVVAEEIVDKLLDISGFVYTPIPKENIYESNGVFGTCERELSID